MITVDAIGSTGKLTVKIAMSVIPLIMIVVGYVVYLNRPEKTGSKIKMARRDTPFGVR